MSKMSKMSKGKFCSIIKNRIFINFQFILMRHDMLKGFDVMIYSNAVLMGIFFWLFLL